MNGSAPSPAAAVVWEAGLVGTRTIGLTSLVDFDDRRCRTKVERSEDLLDLARHWGVDLLDAVSAWAIDAFGPMNAVLCTRLRATMCAITVAQIASESLPICGVARSAIVHANDNGAQECRRV